MSTGSHLQGHRFRRIRPRTATPFTVFSRSGILRILFISKLEKGKVESEAYFADIRRRSFQLV